MLLRRCAWHRYYRGYPIVYGVSAWREQGLGFTDGVCRGCGRRVRRDLEQSAVRWPRLPAAGRGVEPLGVPPAAVAMIAAAVLLFIARPIDHVPPPPLPAALPAALVSAPPPEVPAPARMVRAAGRPAPPSRTSSKRLVGRATTSTTRAAARPIVAAGRWSAQRGVTWAAWPPSRADDFLQTQ